MGSPPERLEVEPVGGQPGGAQRGADEVGPGLRAADVDVPLGDVGHPVAAGPSGRRPGRSPRRARSRARVGARAVSAPARPRSAARTSSSRANSGSLGGALQQHRVAGGVVQALGQRPQRRDADACADERDLRAGPGACAEPAVRALDERARAGAQATRRGGCRRRRAWTVIRRLRPSGAAESE